MCGCCEKGISSLKSFYYILCLYIYIYINTQYIYNTQYIIYIYIYSIYSDGLCVAAARREYPLLNHFITSYVCIYLYIYYIYIYIYSILRWLVCGCCKKGIPSFKSFYYVICLYLYIYIYILYIYVSLYKDNN